VNTKRGAALVALGKECRKKFKGDGPHKTKEGVEKKKKERERERESQKKIYDIGIIIL
jgi:hypothetical protein